MSTRLIWSLGSAGIVLTVWMAVLAITFYNTRRRHRHHRAAMRFAERTGLVLPPEFADRLARRLRRRGAVANVITGSFSAAWLGWYIYHYLLIPESEFTPRTGTPSTVSLAPLWAVSGLAMTAAHCYDNFRESRETTTTVPRNASPRLKDVVPPILTWAVRATGILPLLAAAAWLLTPTSIQHGPDAVHPQSVLFAIAVLAAPSTALAAEAVQKWILHGRPHAATAQELALDDALRVETILAVLLIPTVTCVLTAALIAAPLEWVRGWSGSLPVGLALTLTIFPVLGLNAAVNSRWARRYFLGRSARFFGQTPPAAQLVG